MYGPFLLGVIRHFRLISLTPQDGIGHRFEAIQLLDDNTLVIYILALYLSHGFASQVFFLLFLASAHCTRQLGVIEVVG